MKDMLHMGLFLFVIAAVAGVLLAYTESVTAPLILENRQKAEELAKAYGARVTGLYAVSEVQPDFDYGNSAFKDFTQGTGHLDRIEVTGSRISPEDLEVGTVTLESDLYAVFLISE